ncbi:MAG: hypothetical protein ACSHX5_05940 [Phycisphaerales bacterium]
MKVSRIIPVLCMLLFALHGAGIVRSLHNLSHHAQPSIAHSCSDAQSHTTPINQAPFEQPSDLPSDSNNKHDCDICLTLSSITPTQCAPQLDTFASAPKENPFRNTAQVLLYSSQQPGDHAARAPPTC